MKPFLTTFFALCMLGLLCLYFWHPSLSIGDLQWVHLGDNISVIRSRGKNLIGPGCIELHVSSNFVHGVFSDEGEFTGRWFAIRRDTKKVYVSENPDEIERVFKYYKDKTSIWSNPGGCFYRTFQSQKSAGEDH